MQVFAKLFQVFVIVVFFGIGPVAAQSDHRSGAPSFQFTYLPPTTLNYTRVYEVFKKSRSLDEIIEPLRRAIKLREGIKIYMGECGKENAYYDPSRRAITLCYEFYTSLEQSFVESIKPDGSRESVREVIERSFDTITFVLYHEIAHALIDQLNLPVTGREEDAADQLAALLIIQNEDIAETMVYSVAMHFSLLTRKLAERTTSLREVQFWDEHSLDAQRMYDIVCLLYGSNPRRYAEIVSGGTLPVDRAKRCPSEYQKKSAAWATILAPHTKRKR